MTPKSSVAPTNLAVTPDQRLAIVCNTGNDGLPQGHAVSADGEFVAVPLLNGGTDMFKNDWFHHTHGEVVLYRVEGKSLKESSRVTTGAFPGGIAFSSDGTRLSVANLDSEDLSVFSVVDGELTAIGDPLARRGKPGSIGSAQP